MKPVCTPGEFELIRQKADMVKTLLEIKRMSFELGKSGSSSPGNLAFIMMSEIYELCEEFVKRSQASKTLPHEDPTISPGQSE